MCEGGGASQKLEKLYRQQQTLRCASTAPPVGCTLQQATPIATQPLSLSSAPRQSMDGGDPACVGARQSMFAPWAESHTRRYTYFLKVAIMGTCRSDTLHIKTAPVTTKSCCFKPGGAAEPTVSFVGQQHRSLAAGLQTKKKLS